MPLTPLQRRILSVIAKHRDAESFVAGGTVIQRAGIRRSRDIDIFHDGERRLRIAAEVAIHALRATGFNVSVELDSATFVRAIIEADGDRTKLEWVVDSEFRFFPAIPDDEFGFVLHPLDLATNKILAAELNNQLRAKIAKAERLIASLQRSLGYGCLLVSDGGLARPDPDRPETLVDLVVHHGSRKGAWPSSPEFGSVMLRERP